MARVRSHCRTAAGAFAAGVLVLAGAAVPAHAVPLPGCAPVAGGTTMRVTTADFAASDGFLDVVLTAIDSCRQVDTAFEGSLVLAVENVDSRTVPEETVRMTSADAGVRATDVDHLGEGLTFVDVYDAADDAYLGGASVVVHDPEGYPVIDGLSISVTGSGYRATGVTVDPDDPAHAVRASVVVDDRVLAAVEDADRPADVWDDAPPSVGAERGFDMSVALPAGEHTFCLHVDDLVPGEVNQRSVEVDCRVVEGPPAAPFGSFDGLYPTPEGLVASGWAVNPDNTDATALVYYSTRTAPPGTWGGFSSSRPVVADHPRLDVATAHPAYGLEHGFFTPAISALDGWTVEVCASIIETLGCRTAVVRLSPQGALDSVAPAPGGAAVRGWALDYGTRGPTTVAVYVDGALTAYLLAYQLRPDVGAAFSTPPGSVQAYGPDRGYEATVEMSPGRHTVCVYGMDVVAPQHQGPGTNTTLGCRDVVVPPAEPFGRVDGATQVPGGFALRGWAADPDAPTTPLQVHTYRDGTGAAITTADQTRPDLLALDGGRYGTGHGFTTGTLTTGATARVCSYAINVGAGANSTLGCRDLTRQLTPTGALDEATRTSATTATVRGWALDPDTAAPVDIHVYVDGRPAAVTTATSSRGDIAAAFPGWGAAHGYTLTVPATPGQRVCAYAVNTLQGTSNTTLGCRAT